MQPDAFPTVQSYSSTQVVIFQARHKSRRLLPSRRICSGSPDRMRSCRGTASGRRSRIAAAAGYLGHRGAHRHRQRRPGCGVHDRVQRRPGLAAAGESCSRAPVTRSRTILQPPVQQAWSVCICGQGEQRSESAAAGGFSHSHTMLRDFSDRPLQFVSLLRLVPLQSHCRLSTGGCPGTHQTGMFACAAGDTHGPQLCPHGSRPA